MNAAEFNALYEVGTPVFAYPGARPEDFPKATCLVTRTRSKASVLGGHTDVVWVDGHSACIALSHVDVVSEAAFQEALLADTVKREGALPMPAGPAPRDPVAAGRALDLLALMDERAASVVSPVLAAVLEEAERLRAERASIGNEIARFGIYGAAFPAAKALVKRADELVTENSQLRARVAELESGGYPLALPWARLMDDEDLSDFLDELMDATTVSGHRKALAEVEDTIARWRLIAEAQHGHNTAPGPDAVTAVFAEREPEFHAYLHHENRLGHDLPETGGTR